MLNSAMAAYTTSMLQGYCKLRVVKGIHCISEIHQYQTLIPPDILATFYHTFYFQRSRDSYKPNWCNRRLDYRPPLRTGPRIPFRMNEDGTRSRERDRESHCINIESVIKYLSIYLLFINKKIHKTWNFTSQTLGDKGKCLKNTCISLLFASLFFFFRCITQFVFVRQAAN